jgi:hypothetical protein
MCEGNNPGCSCGQGPEHAQAPPRFGRRPAPATAAVLVHIRHPAGIGLQPVSRLLGVDMAPNLTASQHDLIRDVVLARTLTTVPIATVGLEPKTKSHVCNARSKLTNIIGRTSPP